MRVRITTVKNKSLMEIADISSDKGVGIGFLFALEGVPAKRGLLNIKTNITIDNGPNSALILKSNTPYILISSLFRDTRTRNYATLNPEEMGIGGLDSQFADLFRRVFVCRLYPPKLIKDMGLKNVKGILLYGPPGTGKTLMARQISKAFSDIEPIV